ncbi:MAG TPA: MMPL family transporter, partial [Thermomicrobiales bacterium]|nr:MMPL family transporter [Thermomicrobiales bacterium]
MRRLARTCYQHRRLVLTGWIVLLIGLFALSSVAGGESKTEFSLPGSESQEAFDLLEQHGFANRAGEQAQIVFEAEQGVNDPAVKQAMEALFATVGEEVADAQVNSPYAPGGERQISPDGTIAYAEVNFTDRSQEEYREAGDQIREHAEEIDVSGLRIEFGGY